MVEPSIKRRIIASSRWEPLTSGPSGHSVASLAPDRGKVKRGRIYGYAHGTVHLEKSRRHHDALLKKQARLDLDKHAIAQSQHGPDYPMNPLHACWLIVYTLGLWLLLAGLANEPAVALAVEGSRYQYEPATVRLRVKVPRHPENRALTVALVSEGFERSSLEQLDGSASPVTRWIDYRDIPAGEYNVIAVVHRPPDRPVEAYERLTVIGRY